MEKQRPGQRQEGLQGDCACEHKGSAREDGREGMGEGEKAVLSEARGVRLRLTGRGFGAHTAVWTSV